MRIARLVAWAIVLGGCTDPVHSDRVDSLGGEIAGLRRGPEHRPGQPCSVCHGGQGPGRSIFDLAGTVFLHPEGDEFGVEGAEIELMDRSGRTATTTSNRTGNFFWQEGTLGLEFPLRARVRYAGGDWIGMTSPIFRARGCAECHAGAGASSVRRTFISEGP